jgi:hypothetical protein
MYGCHFPNFFYTRWFETEEQATRHGVMSGFEFTVYRKQ